MKTKLTITTIFALALAAFATSPTPAPAPATPAPVPLAAQPPALLVASSALSAAQLQANLNAVPATPQSLLQLLATFAPLPAGVDASKVRGVQVLITPSGGATVTVRYVAP